MRFGAETCAVTIALDRQEKGLGERSAIQELEQQGLRVISIIKLDHILQYLRSSGQNQHRQCDRRPIVPNTVSTKGHL